ncbi:toprim domain-containing protein [Thalassobaculum sp.]|uniref:DUF7146 domain-containing protein n=1 Tax=Thalassobaculum sp. TaxID=2022740 RepID=UPI0032EF9D0D
MTALSALDVDRLRRDFDLLGFVQSTGVHLVKRGDEWRGECPQCGGGSKPVFVVWPKAGRCKCWRCDLGGDALDVVQRLRRLDFRAALQFIGADELPELSVEAREVRANEERARAAERARELRKKHAAALVIWRASVPVAGTPAEAYLVGRGLKPPFPASLRYNPRVSCSYTDATGDHKRLLPALVAAVQAPGGKLQTVHRIYLEPLPDGSAVKAPGIPAEDVKKLHGSPGAGAIRLSGPARSEAISTLVLAEGIETALSVVQGIGDAGVAVWAAISAGQLCRIEFAEGARPAGVVVMADHDRWKWNEARRLWLPPAGQAKASAACDRFRAMGIPAVWRSPVEPGDWLDVMLGLIRPGWTDRIPPSPAAEPEQEKTAPEATDAAPLTETPDNGR